VLLLRMTRGCVVPLHWHTATEELMVVNGTGKMDMPGMQAQSLSKGGYVQLPGRHQHQFTCQSGECVMFDNVHGAFDIHYVDKSGAEIPVAQALQAVHERPGVQR
jgi:anti-sigma factor ChrR (cupin superfamily)